LYDWHSLSLLQDVPFDFSVHLFPVHVPEAHWLPAVQ
jgi:hypothetical protein